MVARPAGAEELRRQAAVLGEVVSRPEFMDHFGLTVPGTHEGGEVDLPCVHSIRSSRRVGPQGQVIFDLIAEVKVPMLGIFGRDDDTVDASGLPDEYGVDDIPVIVQDKRFNGGKVQTGSLGRDLLVNGTYGPYLDVSTERVRLRLLNASNARVYDFGLSDGRSFALVGTDGGPIPVSAQWPETTVLVPVGAARVIELDAIAGDWAMHCHMTHHVMNQMGHDIANVIGADMSGVDAKLGRVVPGYMTMGTTGMGMMSKMAREMPIPPNSIPMHWSRSINWTRSASRASRPSFCPGALVKIPRRC